MSYKVFGTARSNGCKGGHITHLLVKMEYVSKIFSLGSVVDMIEKKERFWSYHYDGGKIDEVTKMYVEVFVDQNDKFLRTCRQDVQENNLFELPIYYFNGDRQTWVPCMTAAP